VSWVGLPVCRSATSPFFVLGSLLQRPSRIQHSVRPQHQLKDRELTANVAEEVGFAKAPIEGNEETDRVLKEVQKVFI